MSPHAQARHRDAKRACGLAPSPGRTRRRPPSSRHPLPRGMSTGSLGQLQIDDSAATPANCTTPVANQCTLRDAVVAADARVAWIGCQRRRLSSDTLTLSDSAVSGRLGQQRRAHRDDHRQTVTSTTVVCRATPPPGRRRTQCRDAQRDHGGRFSSIPRRREHVEHSPGTPSGGDTAAACSTAGLSAHRRHDRAQHRGQRQGRRIVFVGERHLDLHRRDDPATTRAIYGATPSGGDGGGVDVSRRHQHLLAAGVSDRATSTVTPKMAAATAADRVHQRRHQLVLERDGPANTVVNGGFAGGGFFISDGTNTFTNETIGLGSLDGNLVTTSWGPGRRCLHR